MNSPSESSGRRRILYALTVAVLLAACGILSPTEDVLSSFESERVSGGTIPGFLDSTRVEVTDDRILVRGITITSCASTDPNARGELEGSTLRLTMNDTDDDDCLTSAPSHRYSAVLGLLKADEYRLVVRPFAPESGGMEPVTAVDTTIVLGSN